MKEIKLTQGKVALVDDEDYEWLTQWKWCYLAGGYAIRRQSYGGTGKYRRSIYIYMHLGVFISENEAAQAYNKAAIKYFGEFAQLNKIC